MQGLLKQPRQAHETPPEQEVDPLEQQPGAQQGAMDEQSDGENDPALKVAVDFVKRALYEDGAADGINSTMRATRQPIEDMALLAYELTSVADEKTEQETGQAVPDELLMSLAASVLSEVVDIAEASGVQLKPSDIAAALKVMTLRFLGEMGHDTRELQTAFDQVGPEQIDQIAEQEQANV